MTVLMVCSKTRHKPYKLSKLYYLGYVILGQFTIISERIFIVTFSMLSFGSLLCGEEKTNLGEEVVSSRFDTCWSAGHIAYVVFSLLSLTLLLVPTLVAIFLFTLNYFKSPLPYADETVITRSISFIQKVMLAILLVYDRKVAFLITT